MIAVKDIQQGTEEWFNARLGIPTSSNFDKIITTQGKPSKQAQKYLYLLIAERITGVSEEGYRNGWMDRGNALEGEARAFYELMTGDVVEEVGICYQDNTKRWACSPDGLVSGEGILEIKCPSSPVHIGYMLANELPKDYYQQVQGQLLVTGRKWCDFFSYYPGLPPFVIRVFPDKAFQKALQVELEVFVKELDKVTEKIRSKK